MALSDYAGELESAIPRLSYPQAIKIVSRAWRNIIDMRLWSWNFVEQAQFFVPAMISAGSITTTFNSTTIQADATAKAALNAVVLGNPQLASPVLGVGYQIRIASVPQNTTNGPLYNIVAYNNTTGVITIDRPYGEGSITGQQYQAYKAYYVPTNIPNGARILRMDSITNVNSGYTIRGSKLYKSQAQLNAIDPQRGAQGDAYICSPLSINSLGQGVVELYPHPTNQNTYISRIMIQYADITFNTDLPPVAYDLPGMLMFRAKTLAGEWALGNVSTYPELQGTNWVAYIQFNNQEFKDTRIQCIKQDDEIMPQIPLLVVGTVFDFPLGGQFLQNHDVSSLVP